MSDRRILSPYDPREAITVREAADAAGRSVGTIRNWCDQFGIGRKLGAVFVVSRVALRMHLDGDVAALALYHSGERELETVQRYFAMCGLTCPQTQSAQTTQSTAYQNGIPDRM